MKLCFATNNANKLKEVSNLLNQPILGLEEIGCTTDIPETSDTLEGNSLLKAQYVWEHYQIPCFADDTGLEVLSLNNEPGVRSARYAGEERSNEQNMALVLEKLQGMKDWSAQFRTVVTLILGEKEVHQFEGIVKGRIIQEGRGSKGFGYDPIFIPEGYEKSFAEFSLEEKNKISHRGRAIQKLVSFLN